MEEIKSPNKGTCGCCQPSQGLRCVVSRSGVRTSPHHQTASTNTQTSSLTIYSPMYSQRPLLDCPLTLHSICWRRGGSDASSGHAYFSSCSGPIFSSNPTKIWNQNSYHSSICANFFPVGSSYCSNTLVNFAAVIRYLRRNLVSNVAGFVGVSHDLSPSCGRRVST